MGMSYRQMMLEQLKGRVITKPVVVPPKIVDISQPAPKEKKQKAKKK